MCNTKHTPGPWYAVQNDHFVDVKVGESHCDQNICSVHENAYVPIKYNTMIANAQLIASAPELLEALWSAKAFILATRDMDGLSPKGKEILEKANSAINRALGKEIESHV